MAARLSERMEQRAVGFEDGGRDDTAQAPASAEPRRQQAPKKSVRFVDEPAGKTVSRLHLSSRTQKLVGRRRGRSLEDVEVFSQRAHERDRSFVAGPHIGHGRRELRRRVQEQREAAQQPAAEPDAAPLEEKKESDVAQLEPEPEPVDMGPDGGGWE